MVVYVLTFLSRKWDRVLQHGQWLTPLVCVILFCFYYCFCSCLICLLFAACLSAPQWQPQLGGPHPVQFAAHKQSSLSLEVAAMATSEPRG